MSRLLSRWLLTAKLWRNFPSSRLAPSSQTRLISRSGGESQTRSFQPVRLREYQEECIQSVLSSLQNGHKRVGISLATGAGKTVVFTQLIDRVKPSAELATQTLILAHRRELVEQAARHCRNAYPTKTVEVEMGNIHASGRADITVASIQSITSGDRISKFDPRLFKLVLVDEAHHIVAQGYLRTLEHFGLHQKQDDSPILVGVSATFSRFDGLRLGAAIDEIVYHKDYVDMIGEKWLSDVIFTTVESTADISKVKSVANGDFQPGELSRAVNTDQVNEITVRSWLARAAERKSTLVFCVDLAHVAGLTRAFRQHGIDARFVTGDTPKLDRGSRLDAFKRGEFPVLVNCGVFTEGTDIPNIDCVVLARPTRSRNLLVQMIGRGMRLHHGKKNCHVIDMVSSLAAGIVTTPTLFGLDPSHLVDEVAVDDMRNLKSHKEAEKIREQVALGANSARSGTKGDGSVTFVEYDSVLDLISDTSGERHIRSISKNAWVQVGPHRYILSGPEGTYIRLEKAEKSEENLPDFVAWEIRALPKEVAKSPFAMPKKLLQAATFTDAVHGADKYASEKYPHTLIARFKSWRKGPPTEGQLKFLNKLRGENEKFNATNITKGAAADMITKVRHGARGRFAILEAERRRIEKQVSLQEREKTMKLREQVSVGPFRQPNKRSNEALRPFTVAFGPSLRAQFLLPRAECNSISRRQCPIQQAVRWKAPRASDRAAFTQSPQSATATATSSSNSTATRTASGSTFPSSVSTAAGPSSSPPRPIDFNMPNVFEPRYPRWYSYPPIHPTEFDTGRSVSDVKGDSFDSTNAFLQQSNAFQNWVEKKNAERIQLRHGPDHEKLVNELNQYQRLADQGRTPLIRTDARQKIIRLKKELAEERKKFSAAELQHIRDIEKAWVSFVSIDSHEQAISRQRHVSKVPRVPQVLPQRSLLKVELLLGSDGSSLGTPSRNQPYGEAAVDSMDLNSRVIKGQPPNLAEKLPAPAHVSTWPDKPYKILIPDWFAVAEARGNIEMSGATAEERFNRLLNYIYQLEFEKTQQDYKAKHPDEEGIVKDYNWDKQWHQPSPGWRHKHQRRKGGWWKCCKGPKATEAEKQCELCSDVKVPEPVPPAEILDHLMKNIGEAMAVVAENDKKEVLERISGEDSRSTSVEAFRRQFDESMKMWALQEDSPITTTESRTIPLSAREPWINYNPLRGLDDSTETAAITQVFVQETASKGEKQRAPQDEGVGKGKQAP
ncbi:hypothetical protein NUW58_g4227 [Xylaria curta]|uniref:Uncharacterized protein n=1 Tax=Xylaria curta TaxID=42375 RepID=A0ACC1P888_9PEZI|nr:hypothetical protein NUW58_g4227 [Xylaria curta]